MTGKLSKRDVDAALDGLAEVVSDVNGGTRIGSALGEFLADARRAAVARGALVVARSDALERGDPRAMAGAVKRLSRPAHGVVSWSPLACDPEPYRYRPVTRGMAAVLEDLDDLAGVRDLASALQAVRRLPAVDAGPRRAASRAWPVTWSGSERVH
ncbi:MAG: VWA domain-containing protein [Solirubrobacteraceae bacterium]